MRPRREGSPPPAYGGELESDGTILKLPGLVSRKKDFVPALTKAVKEGGPPANVLAEHEACASGEEAEARGEKNAPSSAVKRSRSMVDVARGDVVVDYSEEPSGKIMRAGDGA